MIFVYKYTYFTGLYEHKLIYYAAKIFCSKQDLFYYKCWFYFYPKFLLFFTVLVFFQELGG